MMLSMRTCITYKCYCPPTLLEEVEGPSLAKGIVGHRYYITYQISLYQNPSILMKIDCAWSSSLLHFHVLNSSKITSLDMMKSLVSGLYTLLPLDSYNLSL